MTVNNYKNFDVLPGTFTELKFELTDETGLKINTDAATFKLEIFSSSLKMVLSKTTQDAKGLGFVTFSISESESYALKEPLLSYRLVMTKQNKAIQIWKGFVAVGNPIYTANQTPTNGAITLPDGTEYVTTPTTVVEGTWYAINSFFRFLVTGPGALTIDAKDLTGTIHINISAIVPDPNEEQAWFPDLTGKNAFRIKYAAGSPTVKYLP